MQCFNPSVVNDITVLKSSVSSFHGPWKMVFMKVVFHSKSNGMYLMRYWTEMNEDLSPESFQRHSNYSLNFSIYGAEWNNLNLQEKNIYFLDWSVWKNLLFMVLPILSVLLLDISLDKVI